MNNNQQLPVEVETKIFNVLLSHTYASRTIAAKELAELFSTEYATKLQELRQLLEDALKENNHTAMYPDHFIEKVNKFLNG